MIAIHLEYIFEEREFMRALIQGFTDIEADKEISLTDAKQRLGLK